MAKKDIPSINYFKDKMRMADLLNVYLYGGNKIISPQDYRAESDTGKIMVER